MPSHGGLQSKPSDPELETILIEDSCWQEKGNQKKSKKKKFVALVRFWIKESIDKLRYTWLWCEGSPWASDPNPPPPCPPQLLLDGCPRCPRCPCCPRCPPYPFCSAPLLQDGSLPTLLSLPQHLPSQSHLSPSPALFPHPSARP